MATTKTGVSTKTKVVVGVGLLTIAGLAAYGFVTLNSTFTVKTVTPAPEYKTSFIIMKAADAPSETKVIAGTSIIVGKLAVSSDDVVKWSTPGAISMTVRKSGTASASAFKNWKLCNQTNTCVTGSVSGSDITFTNLSSLFAKRDGNGLVKAANAITLVENTLKLTVKVDISSGYKGTLSLSLPSTSSVSGLKITEWVPSSSYLQKAGIVGPSDLTGIVGPSDRGIVGPSDIVYGETVPQISFSSGSSYLVIGSIVIQ